MFSIKRAFYDKYDKLMRRFFIYYLRDNSFQLEKVDLQGIIRAFIGYNIGDTNKKGSTLKCSDNRRKITLNSKNNEKTVETSEKGNLSMEEKVWESSTITEEMVEEVENMFEGLMTYKSKFWLYSHTLKHEIGHMKEGIDRADFIAIRVAGNIVYLDKDMKLKLASKTYHYKFGFGLAKGICFAYTKETDPQKVASFYIDFANGGPVATEAFCKKEKNPFIRFTNKFYGFLSANPVTDSSDKKVKRQFKRKAKRKNSDQYWISELGKTSDKAIELNKKFKNLHDYIFDKKDGDKGELYSKLNEEQKFIVDAINESKC